VRDVAHAVVYSVACVTGALLIAITAWTGHPMARLGLAALVLAAIHHALLYRTGSLQARRIMAVGGCLAAVVFVSAPPILSDDIFRYLLDGQLSVRGIHPFAYAPDSPKIQDIVLTIPGDINHPHLPTIYPPLAQLLFAVFGLAGPSILLWKLGAAAAWVLTSWVVARVDQTLHEAPRPPVATWLATHPLALVAAGGAGHVDVYGVLALALAAWALVSRRSLATWVLMGCAAAIKLFPLALAAAFAVRLPWRRAFIALATTTLTLALTYTPLLSIGWKTLGSLGTYAGTWTYNAGPGTALGDVAYAATQAATGGNSFELRPLTSLFRWLDHSVSYDGDPTHEAWVGPYDVQRWTTRLVGVLAFLGVLLWYRRRQQHPFVACSALLITLYLVSPVVHPWYLLWLLPFAAWLGGPISRTLGVTILLAYHAPATVLDGGVWTDPIVFRILVYVPPLLVVLACPPARTSALSTKS